MHDHTSPDELLPLSPPVFQILLSLSYGSRHGYGLIGDIRDRTGETMSTSTLYGAIKRMMRDGLLVEVESPAADSEDERRRYYQITDFGRSVAEGEARRIERLAALVAGRTFAPRMP
jgi:DNA-binding PadR family transcriptional regulator